MTAATVLRFGQVNGAGAAEAQFLKIWGGQVVAAFEEANIMMPMTWSRTISNAKSATFPVTWKLTASMHTPGAELVGQSQNSAEREIAIDGLLVSDVFLASIDDLMSHWDAMSLYSGECGRSIAVQMDKEILQILILGSRAAATITGVSTAGTQQTLAAYGTSGTDLAAGLFDTAQTFDERDVPAEGRHFVCKPAQYYLMAQTDLVLNKQIGGTGSIAQGSFESLAGIMVHKSNHVPTTNITTGTTKYRGNFSTTVGVAFHSSAVGTVMLKGMSSEVNWDYRRRGWLAISEAAVGHDYLRPEASIEYKTS